MCAALWFFAQELDRLNSVAADESAEDLRRDFSGRLSDAECSVEGDRRSWRKCRSVAMRFLASVTLVIQMVLTLF